MTRSSSLTPLYGEDFLELVWENGQILVRGGSSSNRTQNNVSITGRTRLSTVYSLLDEFQPRKETDLGSSSHQDRDQHSCQIDLQFSQSKNSSKLQEELANSSRSPEKDLNKLTGNNNNQLCTYSPSQQCSPSSPLKKPRVDSSQLAPAPATTKLNTQKLGCDQRTGKVNFSNFLIPALCLRSSHHQENAANRPTRNARSSAREEEIEAGKVEKIPVAAAASISKVPEAFGRNNSALRIQGSHHVQHDNETPTSAAPKANGIANNTGYCNEPLLACSSVCSLVASNDPKICIRKHEYATDDSTYLSDNDEETEDVVKETPPWEVARVKGSRNADTHNLSERKRRDDINRKIRTLKELIPNCNKVDKASTLDDAIDYLKTLKLQLQIMSMSSGLCNPLMMLPAAVNAPPHLPPQLMGAGMCFRPPAGTGFPCSPPQFPIPPLPAITDTTLLNMFGFSNHMRPMPPISHHHAPNFIPMNNGNSPPTPPLMPATTTPTNLAERLANSPSLDNLQVNAEYAAAIMQATNQVSLHHHSSSSGYPFYFPTGREENRDVIGDEGRTRKM